MGAILDTVGAYAQGHAAANAAKYNAEIANQNSQIAAQKRAIVGEAGQAQVGAQGLKTRAEVGAIEANQGASGVSVNSGSAVDTRASAIELGMTDAMNIRSKATREAYGLEVEEHDFQAKSKLDSANAKYSEASGILSAGSTFLSDISQSASNWNKLQNSGSLDGGK